MQDYFNKYDYIICLIIGIFFGFMVNITPTENTVKSAVNVDITQQSNVTQGTVTYPNSANVRIETRNGQTIIVVK